MVSIPITGDLTGQVTGNPPNEAEGELTLDSGTLSIVSQNWVIGTQPEHGTVSIDSNTGEWTYTVDPTFFADLDDDEIVFDEFTVQVTGTVATGIGNLPYSGTATISIEIEGVCFTAGTRIETPDGARPIDELEVGDPLLTLDRGAQPIRWIESSHLSADRLCDNPAMRPVRITAGSLGPNTPNRDLLVSQQHRILIRGPKVELLCGAPEALVAAKHLCSWPGISIDTSDQPVEYVHILLDRHEILIAEGAPAESLFLGDEALHTISSEGLQELAAIFPDRITSQNSGFGRAARLILRDHEARALA
ncbi:Hint domain-containing protein [Rhodobacteraceae bacterium B1Z28]|uniref:Hint domain-containing protein n=1 Tax=Ruegeria haliotis TaxID=2747601 RepID=A0ABX2PQN5_9RHOB|nr:Hint domain-containing protein [Ruegeria haliotis]NVO56425.1 Hint domain-containing protein [Ruegeria haliotis]